MNDARLRKQRADQINVQEIQRLFVDKPTQIQLALPQFGQIGNRNLLELSQVRVAGTSHLVGKMRSQSSSPRLHTSGERPSNSATSVVPERGAPTMKTGMHSVAAGVRCGNGVLARGRSCDARSCATSCGDR